MSEPERDPTRGDDPRDAPPDGDEPASTPFDNPFFLPVLLWGLTLWFGYDTFLDTEVGREWPLFNRGGFAVCLLLALYFTVQAIRERRAGTQGPPGGGPPSAGE